MGTRVSTTFGAGFELPNLGKDSSDDILQALRAECWHLSFSTSDPWKYLQSAGFLAQQTLPNSFCLAAVLVHLAFSSTRGSLVTVPVQECQQTQHI